MTPSAPTNARGLALAALLECHKKEAFVQEVLDRHFQQSKLSAADRRLAMQMAYGVLRRRGTLDALLIPLVTRERHKTQPWLWEALRLGAFQLALMSNIPVHAAIYETVELAAVFGQPKAKGFLNGVLRMSRLLTAEAVPRTGRGSFRWGKVSPPRQAGVPSPQERPADCGSGVFVAEWLAETLAWRGRAGRSACGSAWFAGPAPALSTRQPAAARSRRRCWGGWSRRRYTPSRGNIRRRFALRPRLRARHPGFEEELVRHSGRSAMQLAHGGSPAPG
ncbi:MAG: transcription antitermination factor NusB [Gemmataceae bacterium]